MQLQSITDVYPNSVSITEIRKDIDVFDRLLEKFGTVKVFRGTDLYFEAVDPSYEQKRKERIKEAFTHMKYIREKYKNKKGGLSATQWLIRERDRMTTKEYYDDHNR